MTLRIWTAAAVLIFALLSIGGAMAAASAAGQGGAEAAYSSYFAAAAHHAGSGARNEEIRQRRIAAALSPLVIQSIVQQPRQIPSIMAGLRAAAPQVAPGIANVAMTSFPGFAGQIAHAAGVSSSRGAGWTFQPSMTQPAPVMLQNRTMRIDHAAKRTNARAARAAAWAISAIAGNPGAIDQVMSRAIPAAPGGEVAVVNAIQAAYPGFASQIAAAAARAPRGSLALAQAPVMPARTLRAPAARARTAPAPVVKAPVIRAPVVRTPTARAPAVMASAAVPPIRQPTTVRPIVARSDGPRPSSAPPALRLMDSPDDTDLEISDPLEPMNRIIFAFNDTFDLVVLRPLAIAYDWIMPDPVIQVVRRVFLNLDAPVIMVNDLLQGDIVDAGVTLGRFTINTTLGLVGMFDPAASLGLERHHADFGQTLHSYDVGAGPYLVLPLLGPASTRGGIGKIADIFFQPLSYVLSGTESLAVAATRGVVRREELLEPLDELRENSIDYYTGLKAAFWQTRQVELSKGTQVGPGYAGDVSANKLFDAAN